MKIEHYDVVVLGAGPGGYVAAIRSAQLGLKTAIVEDQHLGGICLNWGCIPTKTLLRAAELYHLMQRAEDFGLKAEAVSFDLTAIVKRSRAVSDQLTKGIRHLLKKNKVHIYDGWGTLLGQKPQGQDQRQGIDVRLKDKTHQELVSSHVILATGAHARTLPNFEPDGQVIWSAKDAMTPTFLPKSLLILGSGAIGVEFASFYNTLGTKVTIAELQDRILPVEDLEISDLARKSFEKQGMEILTDTKTQFITKNDKGVTVALSTQEKSEERHFDVVLTAIGIEGNTTGYGLENTKVQCHKGHIVTDATCETHESHVYAIGDVAGAPWLAHKASHEGIMVAEKLAGQTPKPLNSHNIPGCTYSMPQIASVGLTEQIAKNQGYDVKIGRFPFQANGKALALGEPEGLVKVIYDTKTGELLGAHMIGAEVTELIQGYVIAKTAELTEEDLMHTVFPHPTLSEIMPEAVLEAYGRALHM